MFEVVSLLVVLVMSLIITRVATVALALTGMSQEAARFQARSALTGSGFTTNESERVVNHPVRRRIIMSLMLIGNTGLVLGASLMVILLGGGNGLPDRWQQVALLLGGLLVLYVVARSKLLERGMARFIERLLSRHTDLPRRDHSSLLRLGRDYRVVELQVGERDWLAGRPLSSLALPSEGVLVLGVVRADGSYEGTPQGESRLRPGDTAVLYGRAPVLAELDERREGVGGQLSHAESVVRHRQEETSGRAEGSDPGDAGSGGA